MEFTVGVTLTIYQEVTVEVDESELEKEMVWNGRKDDGFYSEEYHIDKDDLKKLAREEFSIPDGWEEINIDYDC